MTPAMALAAAAGIAAAAGLVDLAAVPRRRRRGGLGRRFLVALGRRVGAPEAPRDLGERLEAAAVPIAGEDAMALKAGTAVAAALAALPLAGAAPGRLGPVMPLAAAAAGYLALDLYAHHRGRRRARQMAIELPDVLDLLRVALEAGLPPTRALAEVGRRHGGTLAAELRRAAAQAAVGAPRAEALRALHRRAPVDGVAALVAVLERTDRLGTPPAEALAALARDARGARARARAERAAKAAPKIQLVVALLLVPSAMLLVAAALAPALVEAV